MTKNTAKIATLDYVLDSYASEGRNEYINELIHKYAHDFLRIHPNIATKLIDMTYGEVLLKLLPELVAAGGTFDEGKVLKRLVDCEVNSDFVDVLNSVGISTNSIAEAFGNKYNWCLFFEKGLSPEWLVRDNEVSTSALEHAIWAGMIPNLIEECPPEARKDLFAKYLDLRTAERGGYWEGDDFFSLRSVIEAGVSNEDILKILSDHGHVDVYELFQSKPDFLRLALDIDPKNYFLDYLKNCWERFGDESPWHVNRFCDDYSVKLDDDIVRKIPETWFREMATTTGDGNDFSEFLNRIRESGTMNKLEERLFKNGIPEIDCDSWDTTDDEWLYLLLEGAV